MRDLTNLESLRIRSDYVMKQLGSYGDARNGAFRIPTPGQKTSLNILAASGGGWDHVSVSVHGEQRTPTWAEMEYVKRRFFEPDEVAMQLHVAEQEHINVHPYVLHIWRPHDVKIPLPPRLYV